MSLSTFFPSFGNHSIIHSPFWEQVGQGLVYGHIYRWALTPTRHLHLKWASYGYTLLMSATALHSMAHHSFFNVRMVELFRYAVFIAGSLNLLKAVFTPGENCVYDYAGSTKDKGFPEKCVVWIWKYTPSVLAIVNIGIVALEVRERPIKALSCLITFALSYRDSFVP